MSLVTKAVLIFLMSLHCATQASAFGGDSVNNGGGLSEKNILSAYEKIDKFITLCLKSEACKPTPSQKDLLHKIYQALPQEKRIAQIIFASEKNVPKTFMVDGRVRVAMTGSKIGSPIMINMDLLYTKNELGGYDPISLSEGIAILIHELGHYHGKYSHEELDLIAVRVSMMAQSKIISTPLIPWTSEIAAHVFNPDMISYPDVMLSVGDQVIDISKEYAASVRCTIFQVPIPILPIPDIELVTATPAGSILHNVHWDRIKENQNMIAVRIVGNVSNKCAGQDGQSIRLNNSKLAINFNIHKREDGRYVYDPSSLGIHQFKDPWWKFIKLPF